MFAAKIPYLSRAGTARAGSYARTFPSVL